MRALPVVSSDHRRSTEPDLVEALRLREPLALAEAYHRTINASHAVAQRLVASQEEVETLLYRTYRDLWEHPPVSEPLEAAVRRHCFRIGLEYLDPRGRFPAAPSTAAVVADLRVLDGPALGPAERVLAGVDPATRAALVRAHDAGQPTWDQPDPQAEAALQRALLTLAGEGDHGEAVPLLGDWTLGLLEIEQAGALERAVVARQDWTERSRALRRGRRQLEGLPAHPDMGQRILVAILAPGGSPEHTAELEPLSRDEPEPPRPDPPPLPTEPRRRRRFGRGAGGMLGVVAFTTAGLPLLLLALPFGHTRRRRSPP